MTKIDSEVVRRLVIGRKNDGRAVYDPQAKAEVVRACRGPGVSVARIALQCGVNANLLRRWIMVSLDTGAQVSKAAVPAMPAVACGGHVNGSQVFTALQLAAPKAMPTNSTNAQAKLGLHARLPNGVEITLSDIERGELLPVLELLGQLACSGSTTR
jgi:transposase